jgi:hypothetical protein
LDAVTVLAGGEGLNSLPVASSAVVSSSGQLAATPLIAGKTSSAVSGKTSTLGTSRSARGAGNSDSVQSGKPLVEGQASGTALDASTMTRALAGGHGAASSAAAATAGTSTASTSGPDPRETFATLDAESASGRPAWIHAGAQQAEAGFHDAELGWVGVRADSSGGGVHAEVVAGSADAAQALGSHLAGLNAYLDEHHTSVETLTVTAPESGSAGLGGNSGAGGGMQQGAGQQTGQETVQSAVAGSPSFSSHAATQTVNDAEIPALSGWPGESAQAAIPGGSHISVMA